MTRGITRRQFSQGLLTAAATIRHAGAWAVQPGGGGRLKVVFDTDPGIDDAMALLFLHALPQVDLLGITTCFGNADIDVTTRNALYLAERFHIDAPVAKGRAAPLVGENGPPPALIHGKNGLGDIPLPETITRSLDPRPAYRLIIETVRANPGDVTLLAVGRMTNLALALREDPEIASLVKEVVIMGGAFGYGGVSGNVTPAAEANIHGDPTAADLVLGAAWPVTVVGLDVTHRVAMPEAYLRDLAKDAGEIGQFIWDITRLYEAFYRSAGLPSIYVHDASAVAYLADPGLFATRSGPVRVLTEGIAVGQTIQKPDSRRFSPSAWDNRPSQRICIDVDAEKLRRLYRDSIIALARRGS